MARLAVTAVPGQRQPVEEFRKRQHESIESFHALGKSATYLFRLCFGISIKHRLASYCESQMHHFFSDVHLLTIAPSFTLHPIGILHHDAGISSDPIAVKCGLCQSSLTAMKIAFTSQQTVTQHPF